MGETTRKLPYLQDVVQELHQFHGLFRGLARMVEYLRVVDPYKGCTGDAGSDNIVEVAELVLEAFGQML